MHYYHSVKAIRNTQADSSELLRRLRERFGPLGVARNDQTYTIKTMNVWSDADILEAATIIQEAPEMREATERPLSDSELRKVRAILASFDPSAPQRGQPKRKLAKGGRMNTIRRA